MAFIREFFQVFIFRPFKIEYVYQQKASLHIEKQTPSVKSVKMNFTMYTTDLSADYVIFKLCCYFCFQQESAKLWNEQKWRIQMGLRLLQKKS